MASFWQNFSLENLRMVSTEPTRESQFDKLHATIWKDFEMYGFPMPYRELVDGMMRSATLNVLTTIENIDILREEARGENKFNPDRQLSDFCKTASLLTPANIPIVQGSLQDTIAKIAGGLNPTDFFSDVDWDNIKVLRESLARSNMKRDETDGPFKQSWGQ